MNFQIFILLYTFFMAIFFDRKEEASFTSEHFKPKRWLAFIFTVFAFGISFYLTGRIIYLASQYEDLKTANAIYQEQISKNNIKQCDDENLIPTIKSDDYINGLIMDE